MVNVNDEWAIRATAGMSVPTDRDRSPRRCRSSSPTVNESLSIHTFGQPRLYIIPILSLFSSCSPMCFIRSLTDFAAQNRPRKSVYLSLEGENFPGSINTRLERRVYHGEIGKRRNLDLIRNGTRSPERSKIRGIREVPVNLDRSRFHCPPEALTRRIRLTLGRSGPTTATLGRPI